jgi:eukaryotic translation initiation factor 2-alpha kinase 4
LKPSNIFLDANGDVKIGDFGLATNVLFMDINTHTYQSYDYVPAHDESLTAGIGTALYVSPEISANSHLLSRYNAKVDIYSLGIIFFEICYKFSTEMERRMIIMDLRREEVLFPKDFPRDKLKNEEAIIRWCLNHNPKDRPTSMELLRSEYLPPKMEDEYIQESVRTIGKWNE